MILHGDAKKSVPKKPMPIKLKMSNTMFTRYTESLRFPLLVMLTAAVFVLDLFIPDVIPFADEVILGLVLAILSRFKRKTH